MRRAMKAMMWALGGLLLAAAAGLTFLATAGDDFYRWAAKQALEGQIERKIHVEGSFSFDVGLEPRLSKIPCGRRGGNCDGGEPLCPEPP